MAFIFLFCIFTIRKPWSAHAQAPFILQDYFARLHPTRPAVVRLALSSICRTPCPAHETTHSFTTIVLSKYFYLFFIHVCPVTPHITSPCPRSTFEAVNVHFTGTRHIQTTENSNEYARSLSVERFGAKVTFRWPQSPRNVAMKALVASLLIVCA